MFVVTVYLMVQLASNMDKKFFILIGRSGSGKGTQAELLQTYLNNQGAQDIKYLTTGKSFRSFSEGNSYTAKKIKSLIDAGGLCPESFATWNVTNLFVQNVEEGTNVLLDGSPRRFEEAKMLEETLDFYEYKNIYVLYLNVNNQWSTDRLNSRGRADDMKTGIESRLSWFDREVLPIVEYYSKNTKYKFLDINGMQSIGDVHNEIINRIKNVS